MFGAAPGRETIFIFCICWINCSRLYIISSSSFSRDGESIFKKKIKIKPRGERRSPVLLEDQRAPRQECVCGVFIAKPTDWQTTLHLSTRLTVRLLTFCLPFRLVSLTRGRDERSTRELKCETLSAPWQKCCTDCHSSNLSFVYYFFVFVYLSLLLSSDSMEYWHLQSGAEKVNNDITTNKGL